MYRICEVCATPQFPSPSGYVCRNGHGGADWYPGEVDNYAEQYRVWFGQILTELRKKGRVIDQVIAGHHEDDPYL